MKNKNRITLFVFSCLASIIASAASAQDWPQWRGPNRDAKAPDFSLPDENGQTTRLSDFRGKSVVLFFYPKANTPG